MTDNCGRKGDEMDQTASHQRLLIAAAMRTRGPLLELGCGWYSTPLLHEIAVAQDRPLLTIDNNNDWLRQFEVLRCKQHSLVLVGWWGEFLGYAIKFLSESDEKFRTSSGKKYGVCLVDQGQPIEREYATRALPGMVDVFVFHDTEEGFAYGYDRILGVKRFATPEDANNYRHPLGSGMFKFVWTDRSQNAWTTVASNEVDFLSWNLVQLPGVEPVEEVT